VLVPGEFESKLHNGADSAEPIRTLRVLDLMEATWVSGPAKNLIEFARRAAQTDCPLRVKIAVATFHRGNAPASNEFTASCRDSGLDIHLIWERRAFDPGVIPRIRNLVAQYQPDLIQTHGVKSHFLVRVSGVYKRTPWIAFHHGYTWPRPRVRLYNLLDRFSLPSATKVVTVCRPFERQLERMGVRRERIVVRHNSVKEFIPAADDQVAALRRSLGIAEGVRVLIAVGRLSREKGHRDLMQAIALVRKQVHPKFHVVIVGDGPEEHPLRTEATRLAIADCVSFVGHQGDVSAYYTLADAVVLPSHTEGSPNVLLESMAAGLPVIATAVGGVPEIVAPDHAALLVPKQNVTELANAIHQLLTDDGLRREICSAARRVAKAYSPESYVSSMLCLYRSCLQPAEGASGGKSFRARVPQF
jgi:glycosyltransferase involved in cell wall biosynthesis